MNRPPLPQPQMLAAINALHEAEENRLPIAARVAAVAAALGLSPPSGDMVLADQSGLLDRLAAHLQRHVDAASDPASVEGDRELLAQVRATLAQDTPEP